MGIGGHPDHSQLMVEQLFGNYLEEAPRPEFNWNRSYADFEILNEISLRAVTSATLSGTGIHG